MQIRLATTEDDINIKAFSANEWPQADKEHFGTTDVDFKRQKFTFIAEEDNQIAGYINFETDMGVCKIDSIITGQNYRGAGIGKALMDKAEDQARATDCHKISLETGVNWDARKFYEQLGYKVIVTLADHYDHRDFVIMEKSL